MKKTLLILSAIALIGCDKKDDDCNCTMKVYGQDGGHYYIEGVVSDCNGNVTERPSNISPEHFPTMKCE